jgi:hypothetical protein
VAWKPDYATSARLKNYLEIESADDDEFVALWVTAASRNVDGYCGRQFGKVDAAVTRTYRRATWDCELGRWVYVIDDLYDTTGLVVTDADAVVLTGIEFEPENAIADGVPAQRALVDGAGGALSFTSDKWGWPAVPSSITVGLLLMAARLAARRGSPFGVAGSPSDGSEIRLLARLDPDMIQVLKGGGFRRTWWAA